MGGEEAFSEPALLRWYVCSCIDALQSDSDDEKLSCIGFRYRRRAGSGVSSDGRGRLSSVN